MCSSAQDVNDGLVGGAVEHILARVVHSRREFVVDGVGEVRDESGTLLSH